MERSRPPFGREHILVKMKLYFSPWRSFRIKKKTLGVPHSVCMRCDAFHNNIDVLIKLHTRFPVNMKRRIGLSNYRALVYMKLHTAFAVNIKVSRTVLKRMFFFFQVWISSIRDSGMIIAKDGRDVWRLTWDCKHWCNESRARIAAM